jgi:hypothetical protein
MANFYNAHVITKIQTAIVERVLAGGDVVALSSEYDAAIDREDYAMNRIHDAAVFAMEELYWVAA